MFIHTGTTGFNREVIEISIVNIHGVELFSEKVQCKYFYQIIPEIYEWVCPLNKKPPIIVYNIDFDIRIIRKSLELTNFFYLKKLISMYNKKNGENKKYIKLKDACSKLGVDADDSKLHGSSYDALMTSRLFLELAYKVGSFETIAKLNLIRN